MAPMPDRRLWLLEEATPEVAAWMHRIERAHPGEQRRVSYAEALLELSRPPGQDSPGAIVAFSVEHATHLARLGGRRAEPPLVLFFPPTEEALATLKVGGPRRRPFGAVARHLGEALFLEASGVAPERIVRLGAMLDPTALPEAPPSGDRPILVGVAAPNLPPRMAQLLGEAIARWHQAIPGRFSWRLAHLPGHEAPEEVLPGVPRIGVEADAYPLPPLDVLLADPWWPGAHPQPWRAPLTLALPPGGAPDEAWLERLQSLVDLGTPADWTEEGLWTFVLAPLLRYLQQGEAPPLPELNPPDLGALRQQGQALVEDLTRRRPELDALEASPADLARYFWRYDLAVQNRWAHDLWAALLDEPKLHERHALLAAFNAMRLHHAGGAWLFKRLLARTQLGRAGARRFGRAFWVGLALRSPAVVARFVATLWATGRDPQADPLGRGRELAQQVLLQAKVDLQQDGPSPSLGGVPTLYLVAHRHGALDPFLLLAALPGHLTVVVGPRAQRWPLVSRLAHAAAFVLTGRERGVVIADAIAALRARRALALYPEVAEPSYLGEGSPLRSGLRWIVEALERVQVVPVALDDAHQLGPHGGPVLVRFGQPIPCEAGQAEAVLHRARAYFHQHLPALDRAVGVGLAPGAAETFAPPEG